MNGTTPNPDDRGASPVAVARKAFFFKRGLTIGLGVLVCAVAVFAIWRNSNPPEEPIKEKLPQQLGAVVPYTAPMILPTPTAVSQPPLPKVAPQPMQQPQAPLVMPQQEPVARFAPPTVVQPPAPPKPHMLSYADPPTQEGANGSGSHSGAASGSAGASGVTYAASRLDGVQAGLLGDQTLLLTPGILPCIMDTAINSTFEGPIQCHIPFDIRPHGVTLLGRNSIVHGLYRNNVQQGQARVFVSADWVEDPATGCFISLGNAPISDPVGQAGITGNVDNHTWERLGAAIMLDIGQSGLGLAQAALSKGGNTYLSFSSGGGVESIASAILQKQANIPPTITVHQGTAIAVYVSKVLDFSACYDLQLKDRR
ncbi:MAG: TrbI/VirB10 family protein [Rhodopila sp.]